MANPEWTSPGDWIDAADVALEIDGLYETASNEPCSCGSDPEGHCRHCSAWAAARHQAEKLIREALGQ